MSTDVSEATHKLIKSHSIIIPDFQYLINTVAKALLSSQSLGIKSEISILQYDRSTASVPRNPASIENL